MRLAVELMPTDPARTAWIQGWRQGIAGMLQLCLWAEGRGEETSWWDLCASCIPRSFARGARPRTTSATLHTLHNKSALSSTGPSARTCYRATQNKHQALLLLLLLHHEPLR